MTPLEVVWEDPHGLVVNKPAGLLTQPSRSKSSSDELSLEALIRQYLRPDDPGSVYLGTVHRLDKPVSGVILWAKTPKAAHRWSEQFSGRQARKTYWAIIESNQPDACLESQLWDDWLLDPDQSGRARTVEAGTPGAVRAITRVEAGGPAGIVPETRHCLGLTLYPETGRTHQLRAQAASRGWPIVGDTAYGARLPFSPGIALHARTLVVEHPVRREPLVFHAALPASWSTWRGEASSDSPVSQT